MTATASSTVSTKVVKASKGGKAKSGVKAKPAKKEVRHSVFVVVVKGAMDAVAAEEMAQKWLASRDGKGDIMIDALEAQVDGLSTVFYLRTKKRYSPNVVRIRAREYSMDAANVIEFSSGGMRLTEFPSVKSENYLVSHGDPEPPKRKTGKTEGGGGGKQSAVALSEVREKYLLLKYAVKLLTERKGVNEEELERAKRDVTFFGNVDDAVLWDAHSAGMSFDDSDAEEAAMISFRETLPESDA